MGNTVRLEAYTKIDESAKIQGVALIPTISRNENLYTKQELARFDGVTVPLNWEHDPGNVIGEVTFHYNPSSQTVFYEGEITDSSAALLAKNKTLFTSIEAQPTSVKNICNGPNDCFHMPFGLVPEGLALTETPGIMQTTVQVIEKYIAKECNDPKIHKTITRDGKQDFITKKMKQHSTENKEVGNPGADNQCLQVKISQISDEHPDWSHDKVLAVAFSKCGQSRENVHLDKSVDNIMQDQFHNQAQGLESQIKFKAEALELFKTMSRDNPEPLILDQIHMLENDIAFLTNELLILRKDSEFISIEHSLESIVTEMKEKYLCSCCNEVKKNDR